jgi:hypothetical protein
MSSNAVSHIHDCDEPKLGTVNKDTEAVYCANCDGLLGHVGDLHLLALHYEEQRQKNFKTADPETCTHELVYMKEGDNAHCNNCDKFMYDISKGE